MYDKKPIEDQKDDMYYSILTLKVRGPNYSGSV